MYHSKGGVGPQIWTLSIHTPPVHLIINCICIVTEHFSQFYRALPIHHSYISKAFLLLQVGCVGDKKDYIVTVNTIETLTGLDFFPAFDNSIENKAESQFASSSWGF